MAREINVAINAVVKIPDGWRVEGGHMITPSGKAVGFLVAVEHDFEGPGLRVLATDKAMKRVGMEVIEYVQTDIYDSGECPNCGEPIPTNDECANCGHVFPANS